jgi:hypothetical protein
MLFVRRCDPTLPKGPWPGSTEWTTCWPFCAKKCRTLMRQADSCHGQEDNVRFVLLIGCLSLGAYAALVTMRLPSLNRKVAHFLPLGLAIPSTRPRRTGWSKFPYSPPASRFHAVGDLPLMAFSPSVIRCRRERIEAFVRSAKMQWPPQSSNRDGGRSVGDH